MIFAARQTVTVIRETCAVIGVVDSPRVAHTPLALLILFN
jgi:hypothetical protein